MDFIFYLRETEAIFIRDNLNSNAAIKNRKEKRPLLQFIFLNVSDIIRSNSTISAQVKLS